MQNSLSRSGSIINSLQLCLRAPPPAYTKTKPGAVYMVPVLATIKVDEGTVVLNTVGRAGLVIVWQ